MLKKTVLTLALAVSTILVLGAYYVTAAADRMPQFVLTAVQGDEREAEAVELHGQILDRWSRPHLAITTRGSDYPLEQRRIPEIFGGGDDWYYGQGDIRRLIQEHRSFMRGKDQPHHFYHDHEHVVYVELMDQPIDRARTAVTMDVHILDKPSKRQHSFALDIPVESATRYVYVEDVQKFGNEIHVLLYHVPDDVPKFVRAYVIDAQSERVVRTADVPIDVSSYEPGGHSIAVIPEYRLMSKSEQVMIILRDEPVQYFVYSYRTGEIRDVTAEWPVLEEEEYTLQSLQNGVIYALRWSSDDIGVAYFRLDTGEQGEFRLGMNDQLMETLESAFVADGKLYLHYSENGVPTVLIADAHTGETRYKGIVTVKDNSSDDDESLEQLKIWSMSVRQ